MRLHRFFIDSDIKEGTTQSFSSTPLAHQIGHVFRLHKGDSVIFFNGTGVDYVSEIVSLTKTEIMFHVSTAQIVKRYSEIKVTLAVSLIKKDNFEWVIQKGTELGVSSFVPILSQRSEKKGFNSERAHKILVEALEQCGRSDMASLYESQSLEDFLSRMAKENTSVIAFDVSGVDFDSTSYKKVHKEIAVCIGPEGGWSEGDIKLFKEYGVLIARLPLPVLRAETAAIASATLLLS